MKDKYLNEIYRVAKERADKDGHEAQVAELLGYYIKFRPEHARAWMLYGDALRVLGRRDDALMALTRAFDKAPQKYRGYIAARIAMLLEKHRSPLEAEAWFKTATDMIGFEAGWPWILRGVNLSVLCKFQEAIACFEVAVEENTDEKDEALLNIGRVYCAMREYDKAKEYFLQALTVRPDYEEAKTALSELEGLPECFDLIRKAADIVLH